jgi:hypothetical protein
VLVIKEVNVVSITGDGQEKLVITDAKNFLVEIV